MANKKVAFLAREKALEIRMLNEDDMHADALRDYIISNNIDKKQVNEEMGYNLSIELLEEGIITFQFENNFVVCFLPKEISEEQYMSYRKIRKDLKRKELYIVNCDSEYGIQEERYNGLYDREGIKRLDDLMDTKDFVFKSQEKMDTEGKVK